MEEAGVHVIFMSLDELYHHCENLSPTRHRQDAAVESDERKPLSPPSHSPVRSSSSWGKWDGLVLYRTELMARPFKRPKGLARVWG